MRKLQFFMLALTILAFSVSTVDYIGIFAPTLIIVHNTLEGGTVASWQPLAVHQHINTWSKIQAWPVQVLVSLLG